MRYKRFTPGAARHQITVQTLADTPTEDGSTTATASTFCTIWASIEPLGGFERFVAKAQQDASTHCIRTRYVSGITPRMRAVLGTRTFNFTSVNDVEERHRELEIMATEVV